MKTKVIKSIGKCKLLKYCEIKNHSNTTSFSTLIIISFCLSEQKHIL